MLFLFVVGVVVVAVAAVVAMKYSDFFPRAPTCAPPAAVRAQTVLVRPQYFPLPPLHGSGTRRS